MKIKTKLQIVAVLPVIVFFTAITVQFILSSQIDRSHAKEDIVARLGREVSDLTSLTYEYGITQGPRAQIQWTAQYGYIEAYLKEAFALFEMPDEKKILGEIRRNYNDAGRRFSELNKFYAEKNRAAGFSELRNNLVNSLILELQEILPMADTLRDMNKAEAKRLGRYANRVTGLLIALLFLCVPPVLLLIIRRISSPIDALHDGMKIIASGDLRHRMNIDLKDEIGALAQGFNEMAEQIWAVTVSRDELTREIGERKRAEESLRKSEQRLQLHVRQTPLAVIEWDKGFHVISWNPAAENIFGHSAAEALGRHAEFIIPASARPQVDRVWSELLLRKGGERSTNENVIKDGRTILCEWYNTPLVTPDGSVIGVTSLVQDVTDSKRAEEALRQREEALNESQRLAHIGSWDWDAVKDIIWWSDEYYRIYGFELHTPPPNYVEHQKAYTPESAARLDAAVKRAMEIGEPYEVDLELAQPTPDTHWIVARGEAKRDVNGKIGGLRGTAQNITERKNAEQEIQKAKEELEQRFRERTRDVQKKGAELQESQSALMNIVEDLNENTVELESANVKLHELDQLKSMFIASMSHELRTPLNSIIGFSSITLNEWTGPLTTEQKENLAAVLRSGKHLLSLINDVIDVSKIEAGKVESIAEDFDAGGVVREAVETLKKEIEGKGLALQVSAPRLALRGDRRRLLQCLLNLLSNAVKYTQQGSIKVSAELSADGSMVNVAVEDTGIGIREGDIDRLFLPFVRFNAPEGGIVPGTGLGLYLTKKLVREVLKGDILVSSVYGAGSRFTLSVPAAA